MDYLSKSFLLFGVYFLTAQAGLKIDAVSGFATLVWLPTGISLAALFILGFKFFPAIFLGAFFANLVSGAPILPAAGIGIGNSLEAIFGAYVLKILGFRPQLNQIRDVALLIIIGGLLSTLISATIGVGSLLTGGVISRTDVLRTWSTWWMGDMISNLIIAPLIFVWYSRPRIYLNPKKLAEELMSFALVIIAGLTIFRDLLGLDKKSPITYLVFPPLIWIALRFSQRASITSMFLLSAIAVWATVLGFGPFVSGSLSEGLFYLQSFLGVTSGTVMLLAAAVVERKSLEKKKDEFISVASHELRTPLTSARLLTQLLQRRFEKKKDRQSSLYLARINNQIDRLSRLVIELLDLRKIQEGKMDFRMEKFNIYDLVKEIAYDLSKSSNRKIVIKEKHNFKVTADRDRIGQVITNLASNAIKYSPKNKQIIIRIIKEDGFIKIAIQDFGQGIPEEEHQKIFGRFYQIEGGSRKDSMGLGLFIAKEIVDRHKGKIWVESPSLIGNRKVKGSTFYFTLPR